MTNQKWLKEALAWRSTLPGLSPEQYLWSAAIGWLVAALASAFFEHVSPASVTIWWHVPLFAFLILAVWSIAVRVWLAWNGQPFVSRDAFKGLYADAWPFVQAKAILFPMLIMSASAGSIASHVFNTAFHHKGNSFGLYYSMFSAAVIPACFRHTGRAHAYTSRIEPPGLDVRDKSFGNLPRSTRRQTTFTT